MVARKIPAALIAALAFVLVLQVSIAGAFRSTVPQVALAWVPFDAHARSKLAASLVEADTSPQAREAARQLAVDAIWRDALSPVALRVMAQAADRTTEDGQRKAAELVFAAERLTRRDRAAQLWLVQHFTRRGDVTATLRHFDIALRTSSQGQAMVFPLLAGAARDPRFAEALTARLSQDPIWGVPFIAHMVDDGPDPRGTVSLVKAVLDASDKTELGLIRSLMQRLASRGEVELAWDVYTHFGLDERASLGLLQDGNFENGGGFEPFAWKLTEDSDLWAARQRDPTGSGFVLQLGAASGQSGDVARQLVRLAPGAYRLQARMGSIPDPVRERPKIKVRCADLEQNEPLLSVSSAKGGAESRQVGGRFAVPAGCTFQWLSVQVVGGGRDAESGAWVDDIRLSPLGSRTRRTIDRGES